MRDKQDHRAIHRVSCGSIVHEHTHVIVIYSCPGAGLRPVRFEENEVEIKGLSLEVTGLELNSH